MRVKITSWGCAYLNFITTFPSVENNQISLKGKIT